MQINPEILTLTAYVLPRHTFYIYSILCIISLGLFPIFIRYFPRLKFRMLSCRSNLKECTHVVVNDGAVSEFVMVKVYDVKEMIKKYSHRKY